MPDYAKMYALMVRAASAALDLLPDTEKNADSRDILQTALYRAEEMYIAEGESEEKQI